MRLHRLVARAFGPFADEVDIDFDRLSDAGILLIHGPTGGGKTSILDALCFALYANVPGARPAGRSLRSHHAPPTTAPMVSVEFTAGGQRLRVTRSPEFVRPKTRGTGDRIVPATVVLEELTGSSWTPLTTRADEAGLTIRRVLGLGLDQFSRVVLLPQGEFAAFLRATPDDRRAVLERLFDVSRFGQIETWLAAQRRAADHAAGEVRSQLQSEVARLEAVVDLVAGAGSGSGARRATAGDGDSGLEGDFAAEVIAECAAAAEVHLPATDVPAAELPAAVAELTAAIHEIAAARSAERDVADSLWRTAEEALRQALPTAAAYDRGAHATATLVRLDAQAEQTERDSRRLSAHDRAWGIAGDLRALDRVVAQREAAASAAETAREAAAQLVPEIAELDAVSAAHLATEISALDNHVQEFTDLTRRWQAHHQVLHDARRALAAASTSVTGAQQRHEQATKALEASEATAANATAAVALATSLGRDEHDLTRLERLHLELAQARARHEAAGTESLAALSVAQEAGAVLLDLQQRRLDGMAAELAVALVSGVPCPVCGSQAHPSPAQPVDVVTPAEIEVAARRFDSVRQRASEAAAEVARWASTIAAREADVADDARSLESVRESLADLRSRRRALGEVESLLAAAQKALAAAKEAARRSSEAHGQVLTEAATAQGVLDAAQGTAQDLLDQLELARQRHQDCPCLVWFDASRPEDTSGDLPAQDGTDLGAITRHHTRVVQLLARVTHADRVAHEASLAEAELAEQVAQRSLSSGFPSLDEARCALLADDDARDLRDRLTDLRHQRAAAAATVDDEAVAEALAGIRPDLERLSAAAESARSVWKAAARLETVASAAARDADTLADIVSKLAAGSVRLDEEAHALSALADTVAGLGADNVLRMRLSAFVLAGRLEKVVELANERLAVIASGRYRLAHTDALASAGRRSGLGLEVHDLWTGVTRDPATLSGGEAFMASLALALGLADAVHHEAGGVDLQTLFIDEGFGTLDDESLEQVMSVLDTLREGGRAVGVVSHVADLRGRIPTQLRVDKSPGGSTVTVLSETA